MRSLLRRVLVAALVAGAVWAVRAALIGHRHRTTVSGPWPAVPDPAGRKRGREPEADGSCAATHPVKVKMRSRLYHLPGMAAYDRTHSDRCYRTPEDAEADGFTRAKR